MAKTQKLLMLWESDRGPTKHGCHRWMGNFLSHLALPSCDERVTQCATAYVVSMPEMPWMPATIPDRLPIICLHDVRNVADVGVTLKLNYFDYSCENSGTTTITLAVTKTCDFTMIDFLKDFKTSPLTGPRPRNYGI